MLGFFRKYQRALFIIISIVIITTFSFFGTFNARTSSEKPDEIAMHALDGSPIMRSEIESMAAFLSSDERDRVLSNNQRLSNPFNDGVFVKDFLETGLATLIAMNYKDQLYEEFQYRLDREKKYTPYVHPQLPFLGIESIWQYVAPEIKKHFISLRNAENPLSQEAFTERVSLYLTERELSPSLMQQFLYYQEMQWLPNGPSDVMHRNFALFGYQSFADWFGEKFIEILCRTIIDSAAYAAQKGYYVTDEEVKADLIYQIQARKAETTEKEVRELYKKQLRQLQISEKDVIRIWRKVMLFRKLFADMGSSAFMSRQEFTPFMEYASESIKLDLYELPKPLRLSTYTNLQQFEAYLSAISAETDKKIFSKEYWQSLPQIFLSPQQVAEKYPELVQKLYRVKLASVDANKAELNVRSKETLEWLLNPDHRTILIKNFVELEPYRELGTEEFAEKLNEISAEQRAKMDQFARSQITMLHPEWIEQLLISAPENEIILKLRFAGENEYIKGLLQPKKLIELLDKAPLETAESPSEEELIVKQALQLFSADEKYFYRISVLEKGNTPEILTFAEAREAGILPTVLRHYLQSQYKLIQVDHPEKFQISENRWQPFESVREQISNIVFAPLSKILTKEATPTSPASLDIYAHLRFRSYFEQLAKTLAEKNEDTEFAAEILTTNEGQLTKPEGYLRDQWKLQKTTLNLSRKDTHPFLNIRELFTQTVPSISRIEIGPNGNTYFYCCNARETNRENIIDQLAPELLQELQPVLVREVWQNLLKEILEKRNALNSSQVTIIELPKPSLIKVE